jgi:hypothetical protein
MALIMTVYNIKSVINILGITKLIEKLKTWTPKYPGPSHIHPKPTLLSLYNPSEFFIPKIAA